MDQQLKDLQIELQQLKERVALLEKQIGVPDPAALQQPVQLNRAQQVVDQNERPAERAPRPPQKASLTQGMSEEKLAGTLFNRLGIFAIMLAVAFFLK